MPMREEERECKITECFFFFFLTDKAAGMKEEGEEATFMCRTFYLKWLHLLVKVAN